MDEYSSEENRAGLKYTKQKAETDDRGGTKELRVPEPNSAVADAQTLGALTRPTLVWRRGLQEMKKKQRRYGDQYSWSPFNLID